MRTNKKNAPNESNNGNDPTRKSTLVTETNPRGAQYEEKGPNAESPKGKLVDGDTTNKDKDRDK